MASTTRTSVGGRSVHARRLASLLFAVVGSACILAGSVGIAGTADAATNGSWSVVPTTAAGQQTRPFFEPLMAAGSTYPDSVTVINQTSQPLTFNLYPADGFNTAAGGFSLRRRTDVQHDVGAWVHLQVSQVTVPAATGVEVPFVIDAPANVSPGYHVGGIVAESTTGATSTHGALHVTVLQAVATRIYARIIGKLEPGLAITGMSISTKGSGTSLVGGPVTPTVRYTVTNTGNVPLASHAVISLSPLVGSGPPSVRQLLPQLLPHNSVTYTAHFPSVEPYLSLSSQVTLTAPGITAASGNATSLVIPWLLVLVLIVLVVIVVLVVRKRRARRSASATAATP